MRIKGFPGRVRVRCVVIRGRHLIEEHTARRGAARYLKSRDFCEKMKTNIGVAPVSSFFPFPLPSCPPPALRRPPPSPALSPTDSPVSLPISIRRVRMQITNAVARDDTSARIVNPAFYCRWRALISSDPNCNVSLPSVRRNLTRTPPHPPPSVLSFESLRDRA
jgi:hypothetical protein